MVMDLCGGGGDEVVIESIELFSLLSSWWLCGGR